MQWQHGIRTVATRGTYSGNTVHRKGIDFGQSGVPQAGGNGGNTDADDQNDSGFARRHPRLVRGPKPGVIRASHFSCPLMQAFAGLGLRWRYRCQRVGLKVQEARCQSGNWQKPEVRNHAYGVMHNEVLRPFKVQEARCQSGN
ncbi:MAG: hypothetical protein R3F46_04145 [bacterium]